MGNKNTFIAAGIESAITIRYEVPTPKHLETTAKSIRRANPGLQASATL
jgi:hypothetical protein